MKVLIVTGGNRDIDHFRKMMNGQLESTTVIGVDAGALWLLEHRERIDIAVGDFDTIGNAGITKLKNAQIKIIEVLPEKDETDTELAFTLALGMKATHIVFYGGLGSRWDHSMANIHLLWRCKNEGVEGEIIDPWNRIRIIDRETWLSPIYEYVSLIPFTPTVKGVTLEGFKYPLVNATLEWGNSVGISNELVADQGKITIKTGSLILIESNDQ